MGHYFFYVIIPAQSMSQFVFNMHHHCNQYQAETVTSCRIVTIQVMGNQLHKYQSPSEPHVERVSLIDHNHHFAL